MTTIFRSLLTLAAFLSVAAAPAAGQSVEGIAALVNDEPITTVDVRDRMRLIIASTGVQPTQESLARIQDQSLRGLIEETLQLQEAREYEIQVEDAEIENSLADIAERSGTTVQTIVADLQRSGVDIQTLRRQLEAEIAWQVLVSGRYGSRVRISSQQIDLALERLAASASQPQYRLFEIVVNIPGAGPDAERAAQQRMFGVLQQIQQGAPFPSMAREFSDAPSAASGGDIGWVVAGQLPQEVQAVLAQMQPGQLSNPIRVPGGFMVIALADRREGTTTLQFDLMQITLPQSAINEASSAALSRLAESARNCPDAENRAGELEGGIVSDLGTLDADALLGAIRERLEPLSAGQNTGIIENAAGQQVLFVCDRRIAGPGVPSRDDLERDLRGQQLSLLARRWLRDLRRDATIEIR